VNVTVSAAGNPKAVFLYRDDRLIATLTPNADGMAQFIDDTEWVRPGVGYRYAARAVGENGAFSAIKEIVIPTPDKRPDFIITYLSTDKPEHEIKAGDKIRFYGLIKNVGEGASPYSKRMPDQSENMYDVSVALTVQTDGKDNRWGGGAAGGRPYNPGEEREVKTGGGATGGVWTATEGLHILRGHVDDISRVFGESNRWNNARETTIQVGPTKGGWIKMNSMEAPWRIDLTQEGTEDWFHAAGWGDRGTNTRKKNPANADRRLTLPVPIAEKKGHIDITSGGPIRVTWSDGEGKEKEENGTHAGMWGNVVGNGVKFTAPADTQLRRLRVYVGLIEGGQGQFTAKLSDGSAPEVVSKGWNANWNGNKWAATPGNGSVMYETIYKAAKDGETLEVTWSLLDEPNRFRAQFRLGAATLAKAE
jgi:hypothetical protein